MSTEWAGILKDWAGEHRHFALELPVEYTDDGSRSIVSCKLILNRLIEPIFRESGVCQFFGVKISGSSFGGTGVLIQHSMKVVERRKTMLYAPGVLSRYASFFGNVSDDERMRIDQRGTVTFVLSASSRALASVIGKLGEPTAMKNYATSMDRSALDFARKAINEDPSKAVVCLPGRMGLDLLYVFAQPSELGRYLS